MPIRWFAAPGLAAVLLGVLAVTPNPIDGGPARAASFDCAKAATPTEHAICGNPALSALDTQLGLAYDKRLALDPSFRQIQRGWLAARNAGCAADGVCLGNLMHAELAWFASGAARPSDRLPSTPGVCALTSISAVGTRLDNTPGSGSAVSEANQADQVSYDTIPAIDSSRVGDPALVCLISLPTNCPAGDDRGKIYAVADLRTLRAWSAPDSEHDCGGA
jgi:uncharacterized protein